MEPVLLGAVGLLILLLLALLLLPGSRATTM